MVFGDGLKGRAEFLRNAKPELVADLRLYSTEEGGRKSPIPPGWGCPCSAERNTNEAWDGFPILGEQEMRPGEARRVGFVFLSGEAAALLFRRAGSFYLWEGRFIGEATVVGRETSI